MAAKNKGGGSAGQSNKFRFVYFEGDLSDTNMSEIAQVFANAMRPAPASAVQRLPRGSIASIPAPTEDDGDGAMEEIEDAEESGEQTPPPTARGPKRDRKYPVPTYLHDVDLNAGAPPFKDYIAGRKANKHTKRYLLIASWFREHGDRQTITADHVYTAYKKASWPTNVSDWDLTFRQLVKQDRMRRVEPGEYAITPHGEDMVREIMAAE